ncbi:MAG: thiol:disulfide interchange protein DsbA/DsbL [Chromatiales bacterium]|jgi:thiol:disulfide interchange protein DsbA
MKKFFPVLFFALAAFLSSLAHALEFQEGNQYAVIDSQPPVAKGEPIEVVEFFWYGCPHCNDFEPYLESWLAKKPADIRFTRVPVTFNGPAKLHARAYYALDLMGETERLHKAFFEAMHKQGKKLKTEQELEAFLAEHNVNLDTFRKAMRSFAVQTRVGQAGSLFRQSGLRGVPALVVNGRYRSANIKSYAQLLEVLDYMVDKVREEQQTADD